MRSRVRRHFPAVVLLCACILLAGISCRQEIHPAVSTRHLKGMSDSLVEFNRKIAKTEDQEIDDLIARYHWIMQKTPTGVRYMIYHHGNGPRVKSGNRVQYLYEIRLINGSLCYSSGKNNPKTVRLGHSEIEPGLEEGILLMKVGDRAKIIVPSHLAFGLLGDQSRIPPGATLVYDVELLNAN
ncbi:MAG TPA: FKBP-type peptidyl-prolyl cis-trans isomerase [Bacteroidales bacterium]|nr:FKBP-type peptidyl-prolyl cis-trans isomerase [Bacteroidales bacterium]